MVILQVGRSRSATARESRDRGKARVIDPDDRNPLTGSLNSTQRSGLFNPWSLGRELWFGAKPTVRVPVMFMVPAAMSMMRRSLVFFH
jgi:hypothetical protein